LPAAGLGTFDFDLGRIARLLIYLWYAAGLVFDVKLGWSSGSKNKTFDLGGMQ